MFYFCAAEREILLFHVSCPFRFLPCPFQPPRPHLPPPSDPEALRSVGSEEKLRRPFFSASLSSPSPRSNPTRRRPIKHDSWVGPSYSLQLRAPVRYLSLQSVHLPPQQTEYNHLAKSRSSVFLHKLNHVNILLFNSPVCQIYNMYIIYNNFLPPFIKTPRMLKTFSSAIKSIKD